MDWYKVTISGFTDAESRKTRTKELEDAFDQKFKDRFSPSGAALFSRVASRIVDDSKDYEYYVTPEAMEFCQALATEYNGQACLTAPNATLNLSLCKGKAGDKYAYLLAWQNKA